MDQTEFPFTLPKGYVDMDGVCHREGVMRLATAADKILPLKDPRVQANPAYVAVLTLSRVIMRLGTIDRVTPAVIEGLFNSDFGYLLDLHARINGHAPAATAVVCPHCQKSFTPPPEQKPG